MNNSINRLFSINDQMQFLKTHFPNDPVMYKQYEEILNKHSSYPSIHTQKQFSTVMNTFFKEDNMDYFVRLLSIIQYTIKRKDSAKLLTLLTRIKGDDKVYYKELHNFMRKTKHSNSEKKQTQADFIYHNLMSHVFKKSDFKINKLMDIGCGNGMKAGMLGKMYGLDKSQIICADIEKWFDYDDIERNKRQITLLPINKKGKITDIHGKINIITLIHTMHHWCYDLTQEYVERMKSIHDILDDQGVVAILEHDTITDIDSCLLDIEHGLWENVIKLNRKTFYDTFTSKYLNFIELDMIMNESGFEMIHRKYFNAGMIHKIMIPDKSYLSVYRKRSI